MSEEMEAVLDEMEQQGRGKCYCEEPSEGESGVIECTRCMHRRWYAVLVEACKTKAAR